jgi:hypothetical protein
MSKDTVRKLCWPWVLALALLSLDDDLKVLQSLGLWVLPQRLNIYAIHNYN